MRKIVTGLGMLLFIGVVIVAASTLRSHADFFSFSAANDSAGAYRGMVLVLRILCDDKNHAPYKEGSDAAAACREFGEKR